MLVVVCVDVEVRARTTYFGGFGSSGPFLSPVIVFAVCRRRPDTLLVGVRNTIGFKNCLCLVVQEVSLHTLLNVVMNARN